MATDAEHGRRCFGSRIAVWALAVLAMGLGTTALADQSADSPRPEQLVARLQRAVAPKAPDTVEGLIDQLAAQRVAALPAIKAGLARGDDRLSNALLMALGRILVDAPAPVALEVIASAPSISAKRQAVNALGNRPIPQPVSASQVSGLTDLIENGSALGAGSAARVLGRCTQVEPRARLRPILARFSQEVLSGTSPPADRLSYVSPRVGMLNQYLLAISYIGPGAIPDLTAARQNATDPELRKWLLLASGMAGDTAVASDLERVVRADPDRYVRWVAVRAYAASAGQNAIPLLRSLLQDETVSEYSDCLSNGRPRYLLRDTAKGELHKLAQPQN